MPADPADPAAATRAAIVYGADRYRRPTYGANHPLGIPRVSLTLDLIRAYGALDEAQEYRDSRAVTEAEVTAFHAPDYLAAIRECEERGKVRHVYREQYNFGNFENPYFPAFYTTPAVAAGASVQGAEAVLAGHIAFNPAGGMHHARPAAARGFCFINDPVLAIQRLRRAGQRVVYLDVDAHHADGVEAAFTEDPAVVTVSLHMDTGYAYPFAGGSLDHAGPLGNAINLPLPAGTDDAAYRGAVDRLWPAIVETVRPDVVVLQAGTDALWADPLGRFQLSTGGFLGIIERVLTRVPRHDDGTPRLLVLGGGGYHPLLLARCWTGLWALLSGRQLPRALPPAGTALLEAVDWDLDEDAEYFPALFEERLEAPGIVGTAEPAVVEAVAQRVEHLLRHHPLLRPA